MLALEKDYALAERLEQEVPGQPRFKVVQGDALRANLPELIDDLHALHAEAGGSVQPQKVKIVANLPYYITTDLLKILLPMGESVSEIAFMLQHEVAERLTHPHPGVLHVALFLCCAWIKAPCRHCPLQARCF